MLYLQSFTFPDAEREFDFFMEQKRTCYDSFYPFQILSKNRLARIDCEPITILYGGNGTGKSTALNVIAEKLQLQRDAAFNRSNFYPQYLHFCTAELQRSVPPASRIVTSDDVFDYMLNIRNLNEGIDARRDDMLDDYLAAKHSDFRLSSLEDYEQLKKVNSARRRSGSRFVRENLVGNVREYSNGESAFQYFVDKIGENALFLLDEPENSLAPARQQELTRVIEDAVRFFGCQFIISTHSPFVLALKHAKIYDLDESPVCVKRWTELGNVRAYYELFKEHEDEF